MWIFANNSFVSVVEDRGDSTKLVVRGRLPGDVERAVPAAVGFVSVTPDHDYRYRATLPRDVVAAAIHAHVAGIDYPNFKGSVDSRQRPLFLRALHDVWSVMHQLQREVAARRRPGGSL